MPSAQLRIALFFIFTLSGFSGLIYESIWTHYLKLFLGHAAYAQTLVLAIFMGGMALGSALASRYSTRWPNLLRRYALIEGVIGLLALVFHPVFDGITQFAFMSVMPNLPGVATVTAFKWGLGALLILPQSVLLGMTFPLMSAGLIRRFPEHPGATISLLYFANSIGGAIGVLASGFFLIKWIGLPGTIAAAGAINIALAALVWRLAGKTAEAAFSTQQASQGQPLDRAWYGPLLTVALLTGAASFIYEIGWIRMLSLVLGASTHAFELMLSAFILGLAFGSLWIRRRIDTIANPLRFLGYLQVAMGLLALATLPIYGETFNVMKWLMNAVQKDNTGYALFNLGSHGIALAIMLPTTFCAGTTLPLITHTLMRAGHGERSIGAVYSANTVGAIVGIFAAVHLGMPLLGLKGLITAGGAIDIGLGLYLLWRAAGTFRLPALASAAGIAAIGSTLLWVQLDDHKMASGVYRKSVLLDPKESRVLDHRDGKTASVALTASKTDSVAIHTNGKVDAAINMNPRSAANPDEATMVLLGGLPQLLHPQAKTIAAIGFGSGLSSHVLLASPTLERLDTIEIEPAMVAVARGFQPRNARVYNDPRSHIQFEDAKTFFSSHNQKYDVIVSEPSNPWVSGVSGLFSQEYYRLAARHLAPNGLLLQWLQLYEFNDELVASVLKALSANFADYQVFFANEGDLVIVASQSPIPQLDGNALNNPLLAAELNHVRINNLQDIEIRRAGNKKLLAPWLNSFSTPANSDYYPVVDQNAARARFLNASANDLLKLILEPIPTLEILGVTTPGWDYSDISPTAYIPHARAAYNAIVFRDALLGAYPGIVPQFIPAQVQEAATAARQLLTNCAESRDGKIVFMLDIALRIAPYLRPHEMDAIWQRLETWPCVSGLSPEEADWLALFKAVGNRDAKNMATLAQILLERGSQMTPARRTYLAAAGMLGHLASGNKAAAQQIWQRYRSEFPPGKPPGMMFRLLAAHSEAR